MAAVSARAVWLFFTESADLSEVRRVEFLDAYTRSIGLVGLEIMTDQPDDEPEAFTEDEA